MYSSMSGPATPTTEPRKYQESCLTQLLMSRLFRRYIESLIVVFFPLVLLTEQEAKEVEGEKNCLSTDNRWKKVWQNDSKF